MKHIVTALALAGTAALASVVPVHAKDKAEATSPPAIYQAVVDCRTIGDATQRLACFDRTVGQMASATSSRDLVILDRESMRETRKGLFGFNLPKLKLFGGGSDDSRDEVRELEAAISGIRSAPDGFPILTLDDGAHWKQTDGRNLFPKIGDRIKIKRAAMGSYMASIGKKSGIRVMRLAN